MDARMALKRVRVVTVLTLVAAAAWAEIRMGFEGVMLCAACTLLGYVSRHLTVYVRIKDLVDRTPTCSVQRVDWSKELKP